MTDKVKRYDLVQFGDYSSVGVMEESENGDWIRAEDYEDFIKRYLEARNLVIVPMEPTYEMLKPFGGFSAPNGACNVATYKKMIASSPEREPQK